MFLDNADPVLPYLHHAENIVFAYENKNVATFKCITFFCSEVLVCKNNDLRALQAVNERHEFQFDLQNACSFHTGGNFRALTFV